MKEKASASARRSKNERIEEELRTLYNFRFNTVKSRTEYRDIHAQGEFRPVTKYFLNSLRREIDVRIGITTSADNIREYLLRLPLLNPLDFGYTEQLLQTVEVSNPEKWKEYMVKWLIGVVACI